MALTSRLFPGDVELGKRDDDHRPGSRPALSTAWKRRRPHSMIFPPRTLKRISIAIVSLIFLYYFFKFMPTDNDRPLLRPHYVHPDGYDSGKTLTQTVATSKSSGTTEEDIHYFNGPIKFYKLATSLHAAKTELQGKPIDNNVLFAASSLRSASTLIPLACEMAMWRRNEVHFALLGRDPIEMKLLKSINGVDRQCKVLFHDARPDFSVESSDFRMEVSSAAALNHINNFIRLQAVIIDSSPEEDEFFLKALREKAPQLDKTLIELPPDSENLLWLTRLDSSSLNAWNRVSIDIVVHAPPASSGSLIRLLKSLEQADYFNSAPPRLTIELPRVVDPATSTFLETFKWPPRPDLSKPFTSQMTLHHRIPQYGLTPEENDIRFLESFWPARSATSHVLLLSAQAEVSPLFYHYLKYSILEYKYSRENIRNGETLIGISLDIPSTYLNDTTLFSPPITTVGDTETIDEFTPFLWEAPNSNAMLVFGDRWLELHSFVGNLLTSKHLLPTATTLNGKLVSQTFPSWLEHLLQLSRLRGYLTLYPNAESSNAIVTVHNELYKPPEEFLRGHEVESFEVPTTDELTADPSQHLSLSHTEIPLFKGSIMSMLPRDRFLPTLKSLALLTWDGHLATKIDVDIAAAEYGSIFQREVGGCSADASLKPRERGSAADLFCLEDVPASRDAGVYWAVNEEEPGSAAVGGGAAA